MRVVVDTNIFVSAALKQGSLPGIALASSGTTLHVAQVSGDRSVVFRSDRTFLRRAVDQAGNAQLDNAADGIGGTGDDQRARGSLSWPYRRQIPWHPDCRASELCEGRALIQDAA
jgi:hypothetical protein